jgi:hypothetical protein
MIDISKIGLVLLQHDNCGFRAVIIMLKEY